METETDATDVAGLVAGEEACEPIRAPGGAIGEGFILSAQVQRRDRDGRSVRFKPALVEGHWAEGELTITASWSREIGTGEWPEIVTVAVRDAENLRAGVDELHRLRAAAVAARDDVTRGDLVTLLREWVADGSDPAELRPEDSDEQGLTTHRGEPAAWAVGVDDQVILVRLSEVES